DDDELREFSDEMMDSGESIRNILKLSINVTSNRYGDYSSLPLALSSSSNNVSDDLTPTVSTSLSTSLLSVFFEHSFVNNSANNELNASLTVPEANVTRSVSQEIIDMFGPQREPLSTLIPMAIIYSLIFITGVIGNVCTCIVIVKNKYMHTTVNYYLFSLAMSDLLLLILGLPQELWMLWLRYPYVFGETFCVIRGFTSETSTNASILTITAFTVERYIAICYPLRAHTMSQLPRAITVILIIWAVSAVSALPIALQLGIVYQISSITKKELPETAYCNVKHPLPHSFEISTICFFVLPMCVISVLYVLIGLRLRKSSSMGTKEEDSPEGCITSHRQQQRLGSYSSGNNQRHNVTSRRSVIKMLGKH
ncbi:neuropeptides capa receptor-like protein, partial [Dinothrombium tinctorium]